MTGLHLELDPIAVVGRPEAVRPWLSVGFDQSRLESAIVRLEGVRLGFGHGGECCVDARTGLAIGEHDVIAVFDVGALIVPHLLVVARVRPRVGDDAVGPLRKAIHLPTAVC